jgi:hypothetical protein
MRNVPEPQRLSEMAHDVIDGEVDPFGVRHRGCGAGFHTVRKIWQAFHAAIRMMAPHLEVQR